MLNGVNHWSAFAVLGQVSSILSSIYQCIHHLKKTIDSSWPRENHWCRIALLGQVSSACPQSINASAASKKP